MVKVTKQKILDGEIEWTDLNQNQLDAIVDEERFQQLKERDGITREEFNKRKALYEEQKALAVEADRLALEDLGPLGHIARNCIFMIHTQAWYDPFSQYKEINRNCDGEVVTWKQLTAKINVLLNEEHNPKRWERWIHMSANKDEEIPFNPHKCISCGLETSTPCHSISTSDLTALKNSLPHEGTSRGKGHDPDKRSDKEKLVEGLIEALERNHKLEEYQKDNIKERLSKLRLELLVLITGLIIDKIEPDRPMDKDIFDDGEMKMWKYMALDYSPEFSDWDEMSVAEKIGIDPQDIPLERGLTELLPQRDKDYFKHGTIPKYKDKIDIQDYLPWWKAVNRVQKYLPDSFEGRKGKLLGREMQYELMARMPIPCEKHTKWHEIDNQGANRAFEWKQMLGTVYEERHEGLLRGSRSRRTEPAFDAEGNDSTDTRDWSDIVDKFYRFFKEIGR